MSITSFYEENKIITISSTGIMEMHKNKNLLFLFTQETDGRRHLDWLNRNTNGDVTDKGPDGDAGRAG